MRDSLTKLEREIVACRCCPRLCAHREEVARTKRRAYRDHEYWGKPVPGFGDPAARIVIVGLAPGAHGSNRTGRPFTGDASGDFMYPALHRCGLASQPHAISRDDGLELSDCWITSPVRCAPPDNRPTPQEFAACAPFFLRELRLLAHARVYFALGQLGFLALLRTLPELGRHWTGRPRFAHGAAVELDGGPGVGAAWIIASYHPSRQNTQTGRLTRAMFDGVLRRAIRAAHDAEP